MGGVIHTFKQFRKILKALQRGSSVLLSCFVMNIYQGTMFTHYVKIILSFDNRSLAQIIRKKAPLSGF